MKAKIMVIDEKVWTSREAPSDLTMEELFHPTAETREKIRRAKVIETRSWYHEARTDNDILIVFGLSNPGDFSVGDEVEIDFEQIDVVQDVRNRTTGKAVPIKIAKNDVHDLRIAMRHGGSRFPSPERRAGQ